MTATKPELIQGSFDPPAAWTAPPPGDDGVRRALRLLFHYLEHESSPERRQELIEAVAALQQQLAAMGQPCPFGRLQLPRGRVVANRYSGPVSWSGPPVSFYRLRLTFGVQQRAAEALPLELRLSAAVRSSVAGGTAPEIIAVSAGADGATINFDRGQLNLVDQARPGGQELVVELARLDAARLDGARLDGAPHAVAPLLLLQLDAQVKGAVGQRWSEASVVSLELDACRRAPSCAVTCVHGCASTMTTAL